MRAIDAVGNVGETARVGGEVFGSAPQLSATGRLAELDGGYIGSELADLKVRADDTGYLAAGAKRVWVERRGAGEVGGADAGCTWRTRPDGRPWKASCPMTASHELVIDTGTLPEGAQEFDVHALDRPGNARAGASLRVIVDHSAPTSPTGLQGDFDAVRDEAQPYWTSGGDPVLPDGSPAAGVDRDEWRLREADGTFTEWEPVAPGEPAFVDRAVGDQDELQVRSTDEIGNVSPVASRVVTIGSNTPPFWGTFDKCPDPEKLPPEEHLTYLR